LAPNAHNPATPLAAMTTHAHATCTSLSIGSNVQEAP
jgi:hypothetical protein